VFRKHVSPWIQALPRSQGALKFNQSERGHVQRALKSRSLALLFPRLRRLHSSTMTTKKRETQRIHWSWRASYHGSLDDFSEDENPEVLYLIGQLADYCESFCFQLESAETGYLHFQGCLQLINKRRKHDILRKIHPFEYLAPNKGTPKQAWHYCSKDETRLYGPWFIGAPQILDVKEKLADFVDACQQPDITERDLWLKYL